MPATVICTKCGQRKKSQLHHCTPNKVEQYQKLKDKFGDEAELV